MCVFVVKYSRNKNLFKNKVLSCYFLYKTTVFGGISELKGQCT